MLKNVESVFDCGTTFVEISVMDFDDLLHFGICIKFSKSLFCLNSQSSIARSLFIFLIVSDHCKFFDFQNLGKLKCVLFLS